MEEHLTTAVTWNGDRLTLHGQHSIIVDGRAYEAVSGLCARAREVVLVPEEVATRHHVLPVLARADGFTHDVLVTVGLVLRPHDAVAITSAHALVWNRRVHLISRGNVKRFPHKRLETRKLYSQGLMNRRTHG